MEWDWGAAISAAPFLFRAGHVLGPGSTDNLVCADSTPPPPMLRAALIQLPPSIAYSFPVRGSLPPRLSAPSASPR